MQSDSERFEAEDLARSISDVWSPVRTGHAMVAGHFAILRAWQADVRARLPHLDREIVSQKGALYRAASLALEYVGHCMTPGTPARPAGPGDERDGLTTEAHEEPCEAQARAAACAQTWVTIPLSWSDLSEAYGRLSHRLRQYAVKRGGEAAASRAATASADLRVSIADARIVALERELSADRAEAVATQHLAGRFLSNASHELRTPLTAVLGFAELLLEETYGALTPEQHTAIGHIEESAQNLLESVNNLLDLLQIRAGKLTPHYRPVHIEQHLRSLYSILTPLAGRRNVRFELDLAPGIGVIQADENIVRHIVYHLLASALRSTPAHGVVTLSARRDTDNVTIETRDTALHLPPEAIANMMGPFPLLENSPVRGYEGWEVGLPLVRRYVDVHGGSLQTESLPDQGTIFRVVLPVHRP